MISDISSVTVDGVVVPFEELTHQDKNCRHCHNPSATLQADWKNYSFPSCSNEECKEGAAREMLRRYKDTHN